MKPKLKQFKDILTKAGFYSTAKGNHTMWRHPNFPDLRVILSGKDGNDTYTYQIDDIKNALRKAEGRNEL